MLLIPDTKFELKEVKNDTRIRDGFALGIKITVIVGVLFLDGSLRHVLAKGNIASVSEAPIIINKTQDNPAKFDLEKIMNKAEYDALNDIIIRASGAYVYVPETDTVLFSKNEDSVYSLASVIKLVVALQATDLILEDEIIEIRSGDTAPYGEYGLEVGEKFTFRDLRHIMLVASSNDAAWIIARHAGEKIIKSNPALVGKAPQLVFLDQMNLKSRSLGLQTISSRTVTGLDLQGESVASAFGSAKDVSKLVGIIIKDYPQISNDSRQLQIDVQSNVKVHSYNNTNKYLSTIDKLLLSKTGFTRMTGGNLVIARKINDNASVVVVVLGSDKEGRFLDTLTINSALGKVFQ